MQLVDGHVGSGLFARQCARLPRSPRKQHGSHDLDGKRAATGCSLGNHTEFTQSHQLNDVERVGVLHQSRHRINLKLDLFAQNCPHSGN